MYVHIYMYIFQFYSIQLLFIQFDSLEPLLDPPLSSLLFSCPVNIVYSPRLSYFIYYSFAMNIDILRTCYSVIYPALTLCDPIRLYAEAPNLSITIFYSNLIYPAAYICMFFVSSGLVQFVRRCFYFFMLCLTVTSHHVSCHVVLPGILTS